ncbi:MAG: MFS transporter [Halomonas sp.]|uniref:MFS transporter n=1 Tax=Halomonas sp. TaxID=1486246 RepID=UPI003F9005E6
MKARDISQTQFFEQLTGDEDSRLCKDISEAACNEQPRNFLLHLLAALGNKMADEMSNARLVLPWLMGTIGAPIWMIGLLVPIREAGALLPQMFVAGMMRARPVRKWFWVIGGALQALAALGLGLLALGGSGVLGGALVLLALTVLATARGISSIATKDVLGKTIAKGRRGTLMGWSGSIAGAMTLAVGGILMLFEDRPGGPALAILMAVAAAGWTLNAVCAARIGEEPGAVEGGDNAWHAMRDGLRMLRSDSTLLQFNLTRALLLSSALALPYVVILGQRNDGKGGLEGLGILVVVSGLAGMLASPLWGKRSDASSRRVMRDGAIGAATSCLLAAAVSWWSAEGQYGIWLYALVYALLVIAHAGIRLGRKTYIVDMSHSDNRALYVALSNTLTGALMLVFGAMVGALAQWLDAAGLLVVLAAIALTGAAVAQRLPEVTSPA